FTNYFTIRRDIYYVRCPDVLKQKGTGGNRGNRESIRSRLVHYRGAISVPPGGGWLLCLGRLTASSRIFSSRKYTSTASFCASRTVPANLMCGAIKWRFSWASSTEASGSRNAVSQAFGSTAAPPTMTRAVPDESRLIRRACWARHRIAS